ncbi:MAG: energy-coupling factor transporter transmembrane protein EcfT [Campylobacterales bacterium]|nr:energy-coupling factor transporter transmembrane protein EcfT [Campylobacterales bacterium]
MAIFYSEKREQLDYSVGIISLVLYSFFVANVKDIDILLLVPILIQLIVVKPDLKQLLGRILKVNFFIGVTFLILFLEGKENLAWLVLFRANLILWFTLSFNFDGVKIYKGVVNMKISDKFALMLFFTVKYIEVLFSNAKRLKEVSILRGFKGRMSIQTLKTYGDIFAFLIFTTVKKIDLVHDVIHLRTKDNKLMSKRKVEFGVWEFLLIGSIVGVMVVYYFK